MSEEKQDTEILDWLQKQSNGMLWIARESTTGRGYRVHTDPHMGMFTDVRAAILSAIRRDEARLSALEQTHLGDADKGTGIYSRPSGPNERVKKYKVWVESCDRGSFAKDSPSDIAIKAQIRCLRQLLEYLEGDEYLAAHVEHAVNSTPATTGGNK